MADEVEVSDRAVWQELRTQYWQSMKPKLWLLGTFLGASVMIVLLDSTRKELTNSHDKPYTPRSIAAALEKSELESAANDLVAATKGDERYEKIDDALAALLGKTDSVKKLAHDLASIRLKYKTEIDNLDQMIGKEAKTIASSESDDAKALLTSLRARRAELVNARTAEASDADQDRLRQVRSWYTERLKAIDAEIRATNPIANTPDPAELKNETIKTLRAERKDLVEARDAQLKESPAAEAATINEYYSPRIAAIDFAIRNGVASKTPSLPMDVLKAKMRLARLTAERAQTIADQNEALQDAAKIENPRVRHRYAQPVANIDQEIHEAAIEVARSAKATEKSKTLLATLRARRADLLAARTAEMEEAEKAAASKKVELTQVFYDRNVPKEARVEFGVARQFPDLNKFLEKAVDPKHPLSVIYDILWFASLIIAIVAFVALLLTPLFRALPVGGAEEPFMTQVRNLFTRGPRNFAGAAARIAAMTIGTAALVGVASNAPSSPVYEAPAATAVAIETPVRPSLITSQKPAPPTFSLPATPVAGLVPTPPLVEGDTSLPPEQKPLPPPTDVAVPDPLAEVKKDVEVLKGDNESNKKALEEHKGKIDDLKSVPEQMKALVDKDVTQDQKDDAVFEVAARAGTTAESADKKANEASDKVAAVDDFVKNAKKEIDSHATAIKQGVAVQYQTGERPGILRSFLGFDRYRVTAATIEYLNQAGAPKVVVNAARALRCKETHPAPDHTTSDKPEPEEDPVSETAKPCTTGMSNDALRLALRERVCGSAENCDPYLRWRDVVIRASRW